MNTTFAIWESELTTDCTCIDENEQPTNDCIGWCYQNAEDDVRYLIEEWLERNKADTDFNDTSILVTTEAMNWNNVSAHAISQTNKLIDLLRLNGEYRLRFKLQANELSVVRYSHDEPTGACFSVGIIVDERQPE